MPIARANPQFNVIKEFGSDGELAFLEIIKIDSKKMKIRRIDEYKISKENSSIFNKSIIAIDKRKETIN